MSFFSNLFNTAKDHTFLKVFDWKEDGSNKIIHKHPNRDSVITNGSKLVVSEGQMAIFMKEGVFSEPFSAGTYDLASRTSPIWSFFETIKYGLEQPYKGDVFFISTRNFLDQKWGTPGPIPMEDERLGVVNVRAFGSFAFRVTQPAAFLGEVVGNQGAFTSDEIGRYLKKKLSSAFIDTLGEMQVPILKLASQYSEIGDAIRAQISPKFERAYGVSLTDFIVERVSMPEKVMNMLDDLSGINMMGDKLGSLTQLKAANAMESMASRPGAANPAMDAGMGMAMGQMMAGAMGGFGGFGGQQQAAPPPPPAAPVFHYNGPSGQRQGSAQEIAQIIASNRNGNHSVWAQGWPSWRPWNQVSEIANLLPPAPPTPPAAVDPIYYYNGPSGQSEISASQIVEKIKADPEADHKVWKNGFPAWKPATEVAEIAAKLNSGPPPVGGPPPVNKPPPVG